MQESLTRDDEVALTRRVQAGDRAAESSLVAALTPLVRGIVGKYRRRGVSREDLQQIGTIGLLSAIRRFDPDHGARLSSFAYPFIRRPISRAVRRAAAELVEYVAPDKLGQVGDDADPIDLTPRNRAVEEAIRTLLPDTERKVVELKHSEDGLSYRQIGELIGYSTPGVGLVYRRAVERLRGHLAPSAA